MAGFDGFGWFWLALGWFWTVLGGFWLVSNDFGWFWTVLVGFWRLLVGAGQFCWVLSIHGHFMPKFALYVMARWYTTFFVRKEDVPVSANTLFGLSIS